MAVSRTTALATRRRIRIRSQLLGVRTHGRTSRRRPGQVVSSHPGFVVASASGGGSCKEPGCWLRPREGRRAAPVCSRRPVEKSSRPDGDTLLGSTAFPLRERRRSCGLWCACVATVHCGAGSRTRKAEDNGMRGDYRWIRTALRAAAVCQVRREGGLRVRRAVQMCPNPARRN